MTKRTWQVTCDNGLVTDGFKSKAEADDWAWWGHICLAHHKVEESIPDNPNPLLHCNLNGW